MYRISFILLTIIYTIYYISVAHGGILHGKYDSMSDSQSSRHAGVESDDSIGFNTDKRTYFAMKQKDNNDSLIRLQSYEYEKMINSLNVFGQIVSSGDIFRIDEIKSSKNNTSPSKCWKDLKILTASVLFLRKWTIPFLDSAGKPGPSLTKGWLEFVGNYDQCHEAVAPPRVEKGPPAFKGDYCVLTFSTSQPFIKPKIGLCLPDSCSTLEIEAIASEFVNLYDLGISLDPVICPSHETKVTAATVMAIIILTLIGCLIILGTFYDVLYVQKWELSKKYDASNPVYNSSTGILIEQTPTPRSYRTIPKESGSSKSRFETMKKVLVAFSAYTNGKSILYVSETSELLGSLHGLRFLSIAWVILGHEYYYGLFYSKNKLSIIPVYFNRWTFGVVANMFFSVDTFFVISGILISYKYIPEMTKHGLNIGWGKFYYHRFWRLTPPYMLVMVIGLGLNQYLGKGPFWPNTQRHDEPNCEQFWWKNLLYINNFWTHENMCMGHSWYLSNNMQFFVFSPLILIPFYYHRLAGIISCLVFLLASWITTGVLSSVNHWYTTPVSISTTPTGKQEWTDDYYIKPWCRIGPFIVGMLAGYLLTITKGKLLRMKWWVVALGWIISSGSALSLVYGLHGDTSGEHPSSTEVAALYNSIARSVWGAVICWIVITCDTGYGGPVNTFLSWSPFVVLGRMSYMTYLIHPYILHVFFNNMGSLYYANDSTMAICFIGLTVFCTFAAFFFMLAFETPMVALEKQFTMKKPTK